MKANPPQANFGELPRPRGRASYAKGRGLKNRLPPTPLDMRSVAGKIRAIGRAASVHSDAARLTQAGSIRMTLIASGGAAASLATTFFRLECAEPSIRDVQPSSLGVFPVMARGGGHIRFVDGRVEPSHPLTLITPNDAAATFVVTAPWEMFGRCSARSAGQV